MFLCLCWHLQFSLLIRESQLLAGTKNHRKQMTAIQTIRLLIVVSLLCERTHGLGINQVSSFLKQEYRPSNTALGCQLLGMNAANPTDFTFSWKGFARRGGDTDVHCHGWGIAFYEGRGVRAFHDPEPASSSPIAALVSSYPMKTHNMIAHIRYATQGEVCLENVHPFQREMVSFKIYVII